MITSKNTVPALGINIVNLNASDIGLKLGTEHNNTFTLCECLRRAAVNYDRVIVRLHLDGAVKGTFGYAFGAGFVIPENVWLVLTDGRYERAL